MRMREEGAKIKIQWSRFLKGRIFEVTDGAPIVSWHTFIEEISHGIGMEKQLSVKWKSYLKLIK